MEHNYILKLWEMSKSVMICELIIDHNAEFLFYSTEKIT